MVTAIRRHPLMDSERGGLKTFKRAVVEYLKRFSVNRSSLISVDKLPGEPLILSKPPT